MVEVKSFMVSCLFFMVSSKNQSLIENLTRPIGYNKNKTPLKKSK